MSITRIASLADPRLDAFRQIRQPRSGQSGGLFVVEGHTLVRRLLRSDFQVDAVLLAECQLDRYRPLAQTGTQLLVVDDAGIDALVGFKFHRGVLAAAQRKGNPDLAALCARTPRFTLLACPDVRDPENLGALVRTAHAFGTAAVLLGQHCCDPFSRRVLRVSMGAALYLPIVVCEDLATELECLRSSFDVQLWATATDRTAQPFDAVARPDRLALLLGSEGAGLTADWIARCDEQITVPMQPGIDSLNVALAAGLMLYHFSR